MSQRALLLAVRDVLRAAKTNTPPALVGAGLTAAQCDVMFDGQPPPAAGELFVAIHPTSWTADDTEGLNEVYGFDLTVTVRLGTLPRDRQNTVNPLAGALGESLDQILESIRALLHLDRGSDQVLTQANTYLPGANGFVEPPRFTGCGLPEPKGPDWFSTDVETQGRLPPVGLAQALHFAGARRVQHIESEE